MPVTAIPIVSIVAIGFRVFVVPILLGPGHIGGMFSLHDRSVRPANGDSCSVALYRSECGGGNWVCHPAETLDDWHREGFGACGLVACLDFSVGEAVISGAGEEMHRDVSRTVVEMETNLIAKPFMRQHTVPCVGSAFTTDNLTPFLSAVLLRDGIFTERGLDFTSQHVVHSSDCRWWGAKQRTSYFRAPNHLLSMVGFDSVGCDPSTAVTPHVWWCSDTRVKSLGF